MDIEFMGRAVHITGERGFATLYPGEVFELVRWAKEHEFQLLEKSRELTHIQEQQAMHNREQLFLRLIDRELTHIQEMQARPGEEL